MNSIRFSGCVLSPWQGTPCLSATLTAGTARRRMRLTGGVASAVTTREPLVSQAGGSSVPASAQAV